MKVALLFMFIKRSQFSDNHFDPVDFLASQKHIPIDQLLLDLESIVKDVTLANSGQRRIGRAD
jgi:hypothetical protein